jgi:hypothetical protein
MHTVVYILIFIFLDGKADDKKNMQNYLTKIQPFTHTTDASLLSINKCVKLR